MDQINQKRGGQESQQVEIANLKITGKMEMVLKKNKLELKKLSHNLDNFSRTSNPVNYRENGNSFKRSRYSYIQS